MKIEIDLEIFLDGVHLFNEGRHPAMLTNLTEFYELSM